MNVIKAPNAINIQERAVFLAGSIEMGAVEDWQERAAVLFEGSGLTLWNPRRESWDASWKQDYANPEFHTQVDWELNALEHATAILFYFVPETISPISLLELGLHARSGKVFVACPEGYWRKGNIEAVCATYKIPLFEKLEDAIEAVKKFNEAEI